MKKYFMMLSAVVVSSTAFAQSAPDAFNLSQPDMKGTARFMGMGGAFGALGGDLSSISQNPAGIGVYRNNEVGFTLDLDLQHSESRSNDYSMGIDQTKFLLNNIGMVWTLKLPSSSCPNINFGFTYNKTTSFNRRYANAIRLNNSLSNYIADVTTSLGVSEDQLYDNPSEGYDPWYPNSGYSAPWLSILGYNGYLINPVSNPLMPEAPNYIGQWGQQTSGTGSFDVLESGGIDSYNIALGGNISDVVFWGMDFDITHLNFNSNPIWSESLNNAYVEGTNGIETMKAEWMLQNYYNCSGTGFNYKLGLIIKPIHELRIGFAFHTPTWYGLTETYGADLNYIYNNDFRGSVSTDNGYAAYNNVNFRTPWRLIGSVACVLFNRLIISADYEWTQYKGMKFSTPDNYGWGGSWGYPWDDPWWDYPYDYYPYSNDYISADQFYETNKEIQRIYKNTNTIRLGAEFRVTDRFSVRAGYSFVSSPTEVTAKSSEIWTAGTIPNYRLDNETNYITCGLGYKIGNFYVDLAYVYKHLSADYYAFSPYKADFIESQKAGLSLNNNQIVLSAGFKF